MLRKQLQSPGADPYMALLAYRATPLPWCNLSPAELLMGRRVRTSLPLAPAKLLPEWPYLPEFRRRNSAFKEKQKSDYDRRHRVQDLPDLPDDTEVWVKTEVEPARGQVISPANSPSSYVVAVPSGQIQRNRQHLSAIPPAPPSEGASREGTTASTNHD